MSWLPTTPFILVKCEDIYGLPDLEAEALLAPMVTQIKNTRKEGGVSSLTVTFSSGPATIGGVSMDAYSAGLAILDSNLVIGCRFGIQYGWAEDARFKSPWYWGYINQAPEIELSKDGVDITIEINGYARDMTSKKQVADIQAELKAAPYNIPLKDQRVYHVIEWMAKRYSLEVRYVLADGSRKETIPAATDPKVDAWAGLRDTSSREEVQASTDYFFLWKLLDDHGMTMTIQGQCMEIRAKAEIAKTGARATFTMRGMFNPDENTYPMEAVSITSSILFMPSGANGGVKIGSSLIEDRTGKLREIVALTDKVEVDGVAQPGVQATPSTNTKDARKPVEEDGAKGTTSGLTFPRKMSASEISRSYIGGAGELEAVVKQAKGFVDTLTQKGKQFQMDITGFLLPWLVPDDLLSCKFGVDTCLNGLYKIQEIEETVGRGNAEAVYKVMTDVLHQKAAEVAADTDKTANTAKTETDAQSMMVEALDAVGWL